MPPVACECNCGPCGAGDCSACAHDDGSVCACVGCMHTAPESDMGGGMPVPTPTEPAPEPPMAA